MELAVYLTAGVANGALYALMALGLVMIYRTQSFVPFVNGEFFTAGAFLGLVAYKNLGLPYWVSFFAAILCGAVLGVVVERAVIRPIARSHHLSLVMATAGASTALQGIGRARWGDDIYTFPPLFAGQDIVVLGVPVAVQNLAVIVVAGAIAAALFAFFGVTRLGRQMRAVAQSLTGASIIGIDPARIYSLSWALSGAIGAAGGILAAPFMLIYPDMGGGLLIKGFAAAVLGGLNSVPGAILGGILIGIAEQLVGGYIGTVFIEISAFIVIMAVLLIRPQGLLGSAAAGRV